MDYSKYAGLTLITPNRKEAGLAAGVEIRDESGLFAAGRRLLDTVAVEKLLVTCGKDGMVFFERGPSRSNSARARNRSTTCPARATRWPPP